MKDRRVMEIADALVRAALESHRVAEVVREARIVSEALVSHPDVRAAFGNPGVPLDKRREGMARAFKGEVGEEVQNALALIMDAGCLDEIEAFADSIVRAAEQIANHREVNVVCAVPLKAEERRDLEQVLSEKFGGTLALHEQIAPEIFGGLVLSIGDWHLDASLKGRIDRLKQALKV